jgi:fimbrial isopeptide formation D2 family protein/LPXTG-motif cell wall-anchored protein
MPSDGKERVEIMKKFKKMFAVLAASALVAAMPLTAMAASITINHDDTYDGQEEQTYKAYKILDVVKDATNKGNTTDESIKDQSQPASGVSYTMAADSAWVNALTNDSQIWLDWKLSADKTKYVVKLKDGVKNSETTAKEMAEYFNTSKPKNADVIDLKADEAKTQVDDGYYLITSSLGTNLILATSDIEITEKNDYPKDDKKVETGSVTVGQNATYYITVVVPKTVDISKSITVHDEMPNELSFNDDVKIYADATSDNLNSTTPVETLKAYSYGNLGQDISVAKTDLGDACDFHITIDPANYVGKTIVFKYSAKLTDQAAADTGYVNKEYLNYSEYKTTEKDIPVMTYDFDLTKTFAGSTEKNTSLNAVFNLYTAAEYAKLTDNNNETKAVAMNLISDTTGYVISDATGAKPEITATNDTEINIRGLGAGTYYLVEKSTANGYNVLANAITIEVTETKDNDGKVKGGTVTITNGNQTTNNGKVTVNNEQGVLLPSTGGIGTTVFAVAGLVIMAGAAAVLIIKKRS